MQSDKTKNSLKAVFLLPIDIRPKAPSMGIEQHLTSILHSMNAQQQFRIVVLDSSRDKVSSACQFLRQKGFFADSVPIDREAPIGMLAKSVRLIFPDMIIIGDRLTGSYSSDPFRGEFLLKEVGSKFYKPGIPGGNPRVISTSSSITKNMQGLVGATFPYMLRLVSANEALKKEAQSLFFNTVLGCMHRMLELP